MRDTIRNVDEDIRDQQSALDSNFINILDMRILGKLYTRKTFGGWTITRIIILGIVQLKPFISCKVVLLRW